MTAVHPDAPKTARPPRACAQLHRDPTCTRSGAGTGPQPPGGGPSAAEAGLELPPRAGPPGGSSGRGSRVTSTGRWLVLSRKPKRRRMLRSGRASSAAVLASSGGAGAVRKRGRRMAGGAARLGCRRPLQIGLFAVYVRVLTSDVVGLAS